MKNKLFSGRKLRIALAALFLLAAGAAFSGFGMITAPLLQLQFAPALMRCFAAFSLGALLTVLGIALTAFLFGRFYCAFFCPLGILQDFFGWVSRRKGKTSADFRKTRLALAGMALGMLVFGWTTPFLLLDPYSNAGRMAGAFTAGGFLPLILIAALAIWKKRIYCTAVCPVGTVLGAFAEHGIFRLRMTEDCVKCGLCVKNCPSGCIDLKNGSIDNARCVRCMNCLSVCRTGGVKFSLFRNEAIHGKHSRSAISSSSSPAPLSSTGASTDASIGVAALPISTSSVSAAEPASPEKPQKREVEKVPVDLSRRAFLIDCACLLGGLAAGALLVKGGMAKLETFARRFRILPPGALNAERFASKCTSCQLCTANCPSGIIVSAPGGAGPVSLDLSRGFCRYDCRRCSELCPTGALLPLSLAQKQKTRIALARLNPRTCIVFQEGVQCGRCAAVCPTKAVTLRRTGAPRLTADLCIGCGACQSVCPAPGKAMTVHEIEQQTLLEA